MAQPSKSNKAKKANRSNKSIFVNTYELSPEVLETPTNLPALISQRASLQLDMITVKATYDAGAICDSSGNYATAIGSNPNIIANWTAMSSVWDEYRVLAMTVHFKANTLVGGSSMVTLTPMVSVIDFDNSAALTGYTLAGYYSSNKEFKGGSSWKRTAYMSGAENAVFTSTISPSSYWWVKAFSSGNSASLNLGRFNVTYYVQFRGLGI